VVLSLIYGPVRRDGPFFFVVTAGTIGGRKVGWRFVFDIPGRRGWRYVLEID